MNTKDSFLLCIVVGFLLWSIGIIMGQEIVENTMMGIYFFITGIVCGCLIFYWFNEWFK